MHKKSPFMMCLLLFFVCLQISGLSCSREECVSSHDCPVRYRCKQSICVPKVILVKKCQENGIDCNQTETTQHMTTLSELLHEDAGVKSRKEQARRETLPEIRKEQPSKEKEQIEESEMIQPDAWLGVHPPCNKHECEANNKRCNGNTIQSCIANEKGCRIWKNATTCKPGMLCKQGQCVQECQQHADCQQGSLCKDGQCTTCKSECKQDEKRCNSKTTFANCQETNGCFMWGKASSCSQQQICLHGTCIKEPECSETKPCPSGKFCDVTKGICKEGTLVEKHEQCNASKKIYCKQPLLCTRLESSVKHGFCLKQCSGAVDKNCGGTCILLKDGDFACLPKGTAKDNGVCESNYNTSTLDPQNFCENKSFTCIMLPSKTKGVCSQRYPSGCTKQCKQGFACVPLSSGSGACLKECSQSVLCTGKGTMCDLLVINKLPHLVCVPQ